jgi:hypothetical protein
MPVNQVCLTPTETEFTLECGEYGSPKGKTGCGRKWSNKEVQILRIDGYLGVQKGSEFYSDESVDALRTWLTNCKYENLYENHANLELMAEEELFKKECEQQ